MAEIKTFDADWLLAQWVRWSSYGTGGGTLLGALAGQGLGAPIITDDEALLIDGIVAELRMTSRVTGEAVVCFYRCGRNYSEVARVMEIDRKRVTVMVAEGVGWVDGRMAGCAGLDRVRKVYLHNPPKPERRDPDPVESELAKYFLANRVANG